MSGRADGRLDDHQVRRQAALLSVTLSRVLSHLDDGSLLVEHGSGAPRLRAPAEVAADLHARFPMNPETRQYFTFVYGLLDLERSELRWTSAAHPGPLHLRDGAEPSPTPPGAWPSAGSPDRPGRTRSSPCAPAIASTCTPTASSRR